MTETVYNENIDDCKQAVFFATGSCNSITQQFTDVLEYCKAKQMSIINIFIEQSNDEEKLYAILNNMLDFLAREKEKTAIVAASPKNLPKFISYYDIMHLIVDDNIELHFAKTRSRFYKK